MKKLSFKSRMTKLALLAVTVSGLFLGACKPQDVVLHPSKQENDVAAWVQRTCRQRPDGTCKTMGEK